MRIGSIRSLTPWFWVHWRWWLTTMTVFAVVIALLVWFGRDTATEPFSYVLF